MKDVKNCVGVLVRNRRTSVSIRNSAMLALNSRHVETTLSENIIHSNNIIWVGFLDLASLLFLS